MRKGDTIKRLILFLIVTPLVVLPFIFLGLLIFGKKKILAFVPAVDITSKQVNTANYLPGTTFSTNGPNQVVTETQYGFTGKVRTSFFSGYKDLSINVYQDGGIVVWQGPGDFIAGAIVPYSYWMKNFLMTWWNFILFLLKGANGNNPITEYFYQPQINSALVIPYGAIVDKTLPDPYGVLK